MTLYNYTKKNITSWMSQMKEFVKETHFQKKTTWHKYKTVIIPITCHYISQITTVGCSM